MTVAAAVVTVRGETTKSEAVKTTAVPAGTTTRRTGRVIQLVHMDRRSGAVDAERDFKTDPHLYEMY